MINIYNLHNYEKSNMFSYTTNNQLIIYFILLIILLLIIKYTDNFSYVFLTICLMSIYIYYSQKIITLNKIKKNNDKNQHLRYLNIKLSSLIAKDERLIEILYNAKFIKKKFNEYDKMIKNIEHFLILYKTLKQNKMISRCHLPTNYNTILLTDLRDQLELTLKHIHSIIHILPHDLNYLNAFYQFNQLIRAHLSNYYNTVISSPDHTSQYLLRRSGEDKYDFLDNVFNQ